MAMSYHKVFRVPKWILIQKTSKAKAAAILDWLREAGAIQRDWPANSFADTLDSLRGRGWAHALPEKGEYILDAQLLLISAAEHIKKTLGPTSYLGGSVSVPAHRINRMIKSREDVATVFNDLLSLEDPIALSQMFQVAELCHRDDMRTSRAWVTVGPAPKSLLTRLADSVITIGDEPGNDLVISKLSTKQLTEQLEQFFSTKEQA